MAQMALRFYLLSHDETLAIWGPHEPQDFLELNKRKPQFKLINSYPTRAQAESERQKRQNSN
jgi:hypothetical protein